MPTVWSGVYLVVIDCF